MSTQGFLCSQWIELTIERADGTTERICTPMSGRHIAGGMDIISGRINEADIAAEVTRMDANITYMRNPDQEPTP